MWQTYQQAQIECSELQCGRGGEFIRIAPTKNKASQMFDFLKPFGKAQGMLFAYTLGDGSTDYPFDLTSIYEAQKWIEALNQHNSTNVDQPFFLKILTAEERMARAPFKNGAYKPNGELFSVGPSGIETLSPIYQELVNIMVSCSISAQGLIDHLA